MLHLRIAVQSTAMRTPMTATVRVLEESHKGARVSEGSYMGAAREQQALSRELQGNSESSSCPTSDTLAFRHSENHAFREFQTLRYSLIQTFRF